MKIVLIPENFYIYNKNILEDDINEVKEAFLENYGGNDKFVLEYYYYNREKLLEPPSIDELNPKGRKFIDKFVCDGYGNTKVVHTNKQDITSQIASLSKKEIVNSCFFINVYCGMINDGSRRDSYGSFYNRNGETLSLADILAPITNKIVICSNWDTAEAKYIANKISDYLRWTKREENPEIRVLPYTAQTSNILYRMKDYIIESESKLNNNKIEDKAENEKKSDLANIKKNNAEPELKNNATSKNKEDSFNF